MRSLAVAVFAVAMGTATTGIASAQAGAIVSCETKTASGGSSRVNGHASAATTGEAKEKALANAKRQLSPGEHITRCDWR
ncbi:hypothetical protein [Nocardia wallacei]|uniref:hypothetical protein n=1 Tax=Nocardia wallacei TaxID=480035 RepID=UPI0024582ABF|nr:hypothetical protein [Nocardia wallacei]